MGPQASRMSPCCGTVSSSLGEKFFQEIIRHPLPLDMNILKGHEALHPGPGPVHVDFLPDLHLEEAGDVALARSLPPVRGAPSPKSRDNRSLSMPFARSVSGS